MVPPDGWDRYAAALAERCPECGAARGEPCVYMPVKGVDSAFVHYLSAARQAQVARVGTPTKRPHNARLNRASDRVYRAARRHQRNTVTQASAVRRAAARAEVEFDRREHQRLRAWLVRNAGLFR